MPARALWDARQLEVFFIEKEAVRYIRAVGPEAWAVYTYLVHAAARAGRPVRLPPLSSVAERCGLTEDEIQDALGQLHRYRLLEITEERERNSESPVHLYRIVNLDSGPDSPKMPDPMTASSDIEKSWERVLDEGQALRQMFDAIAHVCDYEGHEITEATRDDIFSAVATIRASGGDADQIRAAAQLYRGAVPDLELTPRSLAAAWGILSATLSRIND